MNQPDSRRGRRKGYYARQIEAEAERQGLTVEEYGVYKGDVGSAVKPINSAGGLLFLSMLITICMSASAVFFIQAIIGGQDLDWGQIVITVLVGLWLVPTAWFLYFKERKASRLRKQNGKTIELPTRRNTPRD